MMETLGCVAGPNETFEYSNKQTLSNICGNNSGGVGAPCLGIERNVAIGQWGSYSGCNLTEQESWVFNKIYVSKGQKTAACASLGGLVRSPIKADAQAADCAVLLKQVGPDAVGSVSFTPAPTAKSSGARNSGGLSKGAQAGIGVGVTILVVFLISAMIGFCVWSRRRKRREAEIAQAAKAKEPDVTGAPENEMTELEGTEREELEGTERKELEGTERNELDGYTVITELDSEVYVELAGGEVSELPVTEIYELGTGSLVNEKWEDKMLP
jgi:hypothetical protein